MTSIFNRPNADAKPIRLANGVARPGLHYTQPAAIRQRRIKSLPAPVYSVESNGLGTAMARRRLALAS